MAETNIQKIIARTRFKAAAWLLPVVLVSGFVLFILLPLHDKITQTEVRLSIKRQNVYEKNWLDSVQTLLYSEVQSLRAHKGKIEGRLVDSVSIQNLSDEIRQLFTNSGIDVHTVKSVIKNSLPHQTTSKSLPGNERETTINPDSPYQIITIGVDGSGHFTDVYKLLKTLRLSHPQYAVETMTLRRSRKNIFLSIPVTIYVKSGVEPIKAKSAKTADERDVS